MRLNSFVNGTNVSGRKTTLLFVLVTLIIISVLNLWWAHLDTRPQPVIDEYVEKTLNLADGMANKGWGEYPRLAYWATIGPRPSLYQVMAAPFVIFVERSPDAMLIVNAIFLVVLGLATYKIGKVAHSRAVGALAALFVSTYPLTIELARVARAHALIPAATALVVLALLYVLKKRSVGSAWLFAGSLLFAFSVHPASVTKLKLVLPIVAIYIVFFATKPYWPARAAAFPEWFRIKLLDRFFLIGFFPAMMVLSAALALWMFLKWEQYQGLKRVASEIFAPMSSPWFYETTLASAVSTPFVLLFIIGLATTCAKLVSNFRQNGYRLAVFGILVLMFSASHLDFGGKSWHTFSGILPLVATLTAVGIVDLTRWTDAYALAQRMRVLLIAFLFGGPVALALGNYARAGWGLPEALMAQDESGLKGPRLGASSPAYPVKGDWHIREILGAVLADAECQKTKCGVALVSHRPAYYSDEAFTYSLVQFFPERSLLPSDSFYPRRRLLIGRIGRGQGGNLNWLKAEFTVILTDLNGSPTKSKIKNYGRGGLFESAVAQYILDDALLGAESAFQVVLREALPNNELVVLLRRTKRFSRSDALAVVDSLQISGERADELGESARLW